MYTFMKVLSFIICHVPEFVRRGIGSFLGVFFWTFVPKKRKLLAQRQILECGLTDDPAEAMIEGGEQPSFIARRLVICAAEDVGLADPQALVIANAAAQAVQFVGWPEGRILLSEAVIYVACAPKSNSAYLAVDRALGDVRRGGCGDVPDYLRDAHYSGAAALGHGLTYEYPHDFPGGWVDQQYLPDAIKDKKYFEPSAYGREAAMTEAWQKRRHGK